LKDGFAPNVIMMNALLHTAAAQGDVHNAIELYKQMKLHKVPRDTISYSIVFRALAKSMRSAEVKVNGHLVNIEARLTMAERLLDQLVAQGLQLSNRCLYNYISCYCRAMRLRRAEKRITELLEQHSHLHCDVHLYTAMIRMYSRAKRLSDAERWLQKMSDNNIQPTSAIYLTLLHLCVSLRLGDRGASILSDMRSAGYEPPSETAKLFDAGMLATLTLVETQKRAKQLSFWNPSRGDAILTPYKNKRGEGRRPSKLNANPARFKTQQYKKATDQYYEPKQRAKHGY